MKFSMLCPVASLLLCGKLLAEEEAFHINPYLQNVTPTSMTVMWESREAMKGTVEFGQNGGYNETVAETVAVKIHEIQLAGLHSDTTYNYRVATGNNSYFEAFYHCAGTWNRKLATRRIRGQSVKPEHPSWQYRADHETQSWHRPELDLDPQSLRINLTRRDATANSEAELSPTFGPSGLDHRIPMYQGDWEAVDRFVALKR